MCLAYEQLSRGDTILKSRELTWREDSVSPTLEEAVNNQYGESQRAWRYGVRIPAGERC
jgi:hypothetical protein